MVNLFTSLTFDQANTNCDVDCYVVEDEISVFPASYAFSPANPYVGMIDLSIMRIHSFGLREHWDRKWLEKHYRCDQLLGSGVDDTLDPFQAQIDLLKFNHFIVYATFCSICIGICSLIFTVETGIASLKSIDWHLPHSWVLAKLNGMNWTWTC